MKIKQSILKQVFGDSELSYLAKALFVFLAGVDRLTGKTPKVAELPNIFGQLWDIEEALISLSDEGYILGTPTKYVLNYKKLKLGENFSTKTEEKKLGVLDLLREFQKQHKAYRKKRGYSGERDMIQLRFLIRNYNGQEVKKHIIPFFTDKNTVAKKGELSIGQFFNFALKHLRKEFGKPSELTSDLGVAIKKRVKAH